MAISLKHLFTSAKADGSDSTLVQPSNWNAEHVLTQATARLLGRTTAGAGPTEEISVSADFTLSAGTLSLAADFLVAGNNLSDLDDPAVALTNLGVTPIGSDIIQGADEAAVLATLTVQSHNTAAWEAGTETRPAVVSPANLKAAATAVAWPRGNAVALGDVDLDTVTSSGSYFYGIGATNRPASSVGAMIVVAYNVPGEFQQISQFAFAGGGTGDIGDVYTRGGRGDPIVWTSWRRVLASSQTGAAPFFGARAWVNFNGTGTVAIRASGNVSSITDNGVGDYTLNLTTAMQDANYAVMATASDTSGNLRSVSPFSYATGSVRINIRNAGGTLSDADFVNVAIFR